MLQSEILIKLIGRSAIDTIQSLINGVKAHKLVISKIVKNSFWLTIAHGFNGITNLMISIYLARTFGPTQYGAFAFALSFVMLFSTLFDFGLTMAAMREFAKDSKQEEYFFGLYLLKSIIGISAVGIISLLSFYITEDQIIRRVIYALSIYQLFVQSLNLFFASFRARQRMEFEAFVRLLQAVLLISMLMYMIYCHANILTISIGYALTAFISLLATVVFFQIFSRYTNHRLQFKFDLNINKRYLLIGLYLALGQGVGDIMINTDSFLLGYWGMLKGVGYYNAASKINGAVLFPMSIITTAVFPVLINALKISKQEFMKYWTLWMQWTLFFSIFITFFVAAKAEIIINLFFTDSYLPALRSLQILMVMAVIVYVSNLYFQMLLVFDQQKRMFYGMTIGSFTNVLLNFALIPHYGIAGSAAATIGGQLVNCILYMVFTYKYIRINPINKLIVNMLILCVFSGALMWLTLNAFDSSLLGSVFFAVPLYLATFMILYVVTKKIIYIRAKNYAS